ncbi:MAG: hypothetical protein ACQES0_07035 [Bacteroidota bacterium]
MEKYVIFTLIAGLIFLASIITGAVLRKREHPYPPLIITFHKLISLAALVFAGLAIAEFLPLSKPKITGIALLSFSGIFILLSLISGALLTRKTESDNKTLRLHRVSSAVTIIFIFLSIIWFS